MSILTIDRTTVFQKTAKGRAEIGQRGAGLAAAQRQILIVVDGQKDAARLAAMFPRSDVPDALSFLAQEGFIEADAPASRPAPAPAAADDAAFHAFRTAIEAPPAPPPAPPAPPAPPPAAAAAVDQAVDPAMLAEAKRFMVAAAKSNIGLLAERLIARIESAPTLADLTAVASQWHMALRDSKRGKPIADALLDHVLALLGEQGHAPPR